MSERDRYIKIIDAIREKAAEVLPFGSRITLYGSRARGDARVDSDWDIHILIPGPDKLSFSVSRKYGYPFEEMGWEMNEEINTMVHSFSGWEKRKMLPIYVNIDKEGIIL